MAFLDSLISFPTNGRLHIESSDSNSIEPDPCEGFEPDLCYRFQTPPDYGTYEGLVALLAFADLETVGRNRRTTNLRVVCQLELIVGCPEGMTHDSDGLCVSIYPEIETQ